MKMYLMLKNACVCKKTTSKIDDLAYNVQWLSLKQTKNKKLCNTQGLCHRKELYLILSSKLNISSWTNAHGLGVATELDL